MSTPDSSKRAPKKRITDDEWASFRQTIGKLYLDEGKDVKEVRDTMKREYNFDAHEKAYKRKFEEWGMTKNVPKEEGLFMVKKREKRREQGKDTIFWRRRRTEGPLQLVPDDKVDRIADRYAHDLNSLPDSPVSTPNNIEYQTPNGTPSTHPHAPRSIPNGGAIGTTGGPVRLGTHVDMNSASEWPFPQITTMAPPPHLPQPTLAEALMQQYQQVRQPHNAHPHAHHAHHPVSQPPIVTTHPEEQPIVGHTNPTHNPANLPSWNPWNQQYF